jgi:class 3 adenylate cyclase
MNGPAGVTPVAVRNRVRRGAVAPSLEFRERALVLVLIDLARFTRVTSKLSLRATAEVLDGFYRATEDAVAHHGGRVVKFDGDACLAVFSPENAVAALDTVKLVDEWVQSFGEMRGLTIEIGANVHLSTVAEVRLGAGAVSELVGPGVVHLHRMGAGPGVRLSEPVYRKLPSARRGTWHKRQPPATYLQADQ